MLARQFRCEPSMRGSMVVGVLSIAFAFGSSPVSAQSMTAPAGDAGTTAAAPPMGENAEGAPALALPIGRPFGFTHDEYVDLSETYETNALGLTGYAPNNQAGGDAFTTLSLGIGLHEHTLRLTGDLQYSLSGVAYANHSGYDQLYNYLTALGTAVIVPEHVFLRATAFISPMLVNGFGPVAAPGVPVAPGVNSGWANTYGYSISPDLTFRLENFARSTTTLTQSASYFGQPQGPQVGQIAPFSGPPSQTITYSALEQLASGSDFALLHWAITGSGFRETASGVDFDLISGSANASYAITRDIAVIGSGGYETFSSNQQLTEEISGAFWYAGLQFGLGPRGHASFQAGEQFGGASYLGDVNYQISPLTTIVGTLTDTITTPAAALLGGAGQLGANFQGNLFNTNFQVGNAPPSTVSNVTGFTPGFNGGVAITNVISRYRAANLSLVHIAGRTQYRLTGFLYKFDAVVTNSALPEQTSTGGEFAAFRNINPLLSAGISVDYFNQSVLGEDFNTVSGSATANYQLGQLTAVYFRAAYVQRFANAASQITTNSSDTAITVGIRRQF